VTCGAQVRIFVRSTCVYRGNNVHCHKMTPITVRKQEWLYSLACKTSVRLSDYFCEFFAQPAMPICAVMGTI